MSVGLRAARGAALSIMSSLGGRAIGLVSTLVLTRFLSQADYGAVMVAIAIVLTSDELTQFGLLQYIVAKPRAGREFVFHAAVYHFGIGVIVFGLVALFADPLVALFQSSSSGASSGEGEAVRVAVPTAFVWATCVSSLFDRTGAVPERILARDLRFGTISAAQASTEVVYAIFVVSLAVLGFGGLSILYANIVQWFVFMVWLLLASRWRSWFHPTPLRWKTTRELFGFGLPLAVAQGAALGTRQWDILVMARLFGQGMVGRYNLAYRLAEIPATHIGMHIADVLLPSFAQMDEDERADALVRGTRLLALVVFPLAMGLMAVAPTVTHVVLDPRWAAVAPILAILSAPTVFRPVGWTISSFLIGSGRPRTVMILEVAKVALLLGSIIALSPLGELWACGAVGVAFGLHALGSVFVVRTTHGISAAALILGVLGPLLACGPMVGAVFGARALLHSIGVQQGVVSLVVEVVTGALVYVPAAFVFAPATARNFVGLAKKMVSRG
jgi:lipopolysaccharide exporter